jgi:hypothetical protein
MMYSEHRTHAISLVILWLLCSTQFHVSQSFTLRVSSTKLGTSSSVIPHGASSRLQESINQNVLQEEVILDPASTLSQNQIDTISSLVQARAQARCEGRYSEADQLRSQLQGILLPDEHLTILLQDMPRSVGGGSQWNLVRRVEMTPLPGTTVLQTGSCRIGPSHGIVGTGLSRRHESFRCLGTATHTRLATTPAVTLEFTGDEKLRMPHFGSPWPVCRILHYSIDWQIWQRTNCYGSGLATRVDCKDVWQILERFVTALRTIQHWNVRRNMPY